MSGNREDQPDEKLLLLTDVVVGGPENVFQVAARRAAAAAENAARINEALRVASDFGMYDGEHHKQWVIDQMVRCLTGCPLVRDHETDGPSMKLGESEEYQAFLNGEEWDEGIAP